MTTNNNRDNGLLAHGAFPRAAYLVRRGAGLLPAPVPRGHHPAHAAPRFFRRFGSPVPAVLATAVALIAAAVAAVTLGADSLRADQVAIPAIATPIKPP